MRNKAQVSLWIIVAVVLVAAVVLFFLFRGKIEPPSFIEKLPEPQSYIEKCARENTEKAIEIILPQGGYLQPENYKLYKNIKVGYLCYNKNYYSSCINQEPLYVKHLEEEIKSYITGRIKDCFHNLEQEYRKKNYQVSSGDLSLDVRLNPKQVNIEINKKFEISKNEETKRYEKFKVLVASPIYDLAVIAQEIVNQEAKFCYFEYLGFQLLYPAYSIEKIDLGGETKIYSVKEKISGKQLNFAVRSCAMPAGL